MKKKLSPSSSFKSIEDSANLLKVLSESNRIKILHIILNEEICVCKLGNKIGIPQNLVSHHLKVMQEADIIDKKRDGNFLYYFVKPPMKKRIIKLFEFINIS